MKRVTYPGTNNFTDLIYDPLGRCVKMVETTNGSVTSTKQFVWCGAQRCEERDGSGSLSNGKQFFPLGQVNFASGTPTNYFYTQDHLGSTREMTKTVSGTTTIEAQYGYDPYGIATKLQGSQDADFQYAGYYMHAPSGLNLPVFRAYSSSLGRFINRDPLGENAGANLYVYVGGNPISLTDPLGLIDAPTIQQIFGPGIANLSDPAFDLAIVNTSLSILSAGGWAAFGGGVSAAAAAANSPVMHQAAGPGAHNLTAASEELLANMAQKNGAFRRSILIAQPGTDDYSYMKAMGTSGSCPNANSMTLLPDPAKITALEEFLHGTQFKLGIIQDSSSRAYAEAHVKQFMIRHSKMLGLSGADVSYLKGLMQQGK